MNEAATLLSDMNLKVLAWFANRAPKGAFVEVGVYKGGSACILAAIAEDQGRDLYLYDTFEGLPYQGEHDGLPVGTFSDTSAEAVQALIPGAHVIKGVFPDTLIEMGPIGFVHADADQYEATRAICDVLPPLMVPGGMILFDDYSHPNTQGCRKAVDAAFGGLVEKLPPGQALVTL